MGFAGFEVWSLGFVGFRVWGLGLGVQEFRDYLEKQQLMILVYFPVVSSHCVKFAHDYGRLGFPGRVWGFGFRAWGVKGLMEFGMVQICY